MPAAPSAATKSIGSSDRGEPSPALQQLEPGHLIVVDDGQIQRDLAARLGFRIQQVSLAAGPGEHGSDQLLADRVQGWVRHLGEELLEVVEQRACARSERTASGVSLPIEPMASSPLAPIGARMNLRSSRV